MMMMVMIVVVMVMMAMTPAMPISVVFAPLRRVHQLASEIRVHQFLDRGLRQPGAHGDAVLRKIGQGTMSDTAGNDDFHALFSQPARKRARLMLRRGDRFGLDYGFGYRVHLDQGEVAAAAEMSMQTVVFCGDRNFHFGFL